MKSRFKAYPALFSGLMFMSFAAIFIQAANAPGIVSTFYRMAIASAVLLVPFIYSVRKSTSPLPVKGILFAIAGGVTFGTDMALWGSAIKLSNATIPTLIANLAPIWVGLGTIFIFKHRPKIGFWVGVFISIAGMFILINKDFNGSNNILKGALMGLAAGFFYSIFHLVSEAGRKYLNTIQYLSISTFSSAVYLFIYMLILQYNFTGYDRNTYLIFLSMGLFVQVCGWFLITYSQGYLPATQVSPTLLGQPVLTYLWATVLLHEILSIWHITGGIIVVIGIYIVHYSRNNKETT